jgi:hypothetical protein
MSETTVRSAAPLPEEFQAAACNAAQRTRPRKRKATPRGVRIRAEQTPQDAKAFEARPAAVPGNTGASVSLSAPVPLDHNTMLRGSLATGLRRLSQWVHTRSWRHWGTRQLSATQLKVLH